MIAIINYNIGNLTSLLNMFSRLSIEAAVTNDPKAIEQADKLLLPGVGHFDTCMKNFNNSGLRQMIENRVYEQKIPVLGICAGAQMMTMESEEGQEKGLGWINGKTIKFHLPENSKLKIPHMGWTDLKITRPSVLWENIPHDPRFYFAHSYHFEIEDESIVTGTAEYGYSFSCAFARENVYGVQFHPEKSHRFGMKVLENFAKIGKY